MNHTLPWVELHTSHSNQTLVLGVSESWHLHIVTIWPCVLIKEGKKNPIQRIDAPTTQTSLCSVFSSGSSEPDAWCHPPFFGPCWTALQIAPSNSFLGAWSSLSGLSGALVLSTLWFCDGCASHPFLVTLSQFLLLLPCAGITSASTLEMQAAQNHVAQKFPSEWARPGDVCPAVCPLQAHGSRYTSSSSS